MVPAAHSLAFREFMRDWTAKLNQRGWGAPAWPKEHGGGGLSVKEQFILSEEFAWRRAPRSGGIGHGWAGPTMMVYGTEEQKTNYLPQDHFRRTRLVPALQRTRRRLRPRFTYRPAPSAMATTMW